jgi:hypothetical protein
MASGAAHGYASAAGMKEAAMPVAPSDRPLASLRQETIDLLIVNYGHGKLSLEAFERRLDQALDAKTHADLLALTADLDLIADKAYQKQKREEFGPQIAAPTNDANADVDYMIHIFAGGNRSGVWTAPREIRMLNLFGGGELDFSQARFATGTTRVRMLCLFGGANFYLAEGMNAVSKALCIFGGIDNRAQSSADPNAPTVIIEGLVLFGGAHIRVKRTLKERWLEFANHVKSAFGPMHHHYRQSTPANERLNAR